MRVFVFFFVYDDEGRCFRLALLFTIMSRVGVVFVWRRLCFVDVVVTKCMCFILVAVAAAAAFLFFRYGNPLFFCLRTFYFLCACLPAR